MTRKEAIQVLKMVEAYGLADEAKCMAIEALQFVEHFDLLKEFQSLQEVVWCKDCRHADECHKKIQYTRNEPNSVTIGFLPIEWCSRGKRREK